MVVQYWRHGNASLSGLRMCFMVNVSVIAKTAKKMRKRLCDELAVVQ